MYGYPATNNRVSNVVRNGATTTRAFTYDGAGNTLTDNRSGTTTTYTYNKRNRLETATSGALGWGYTYNAREQLVRRNLDTGGSNLTHFVHDISGNVIAETNGTAAGTTSEYIWLPEAEIAPTYQSQAQVDRPLAVVDGVGGGSPALWMVHVDHLNRPIKMTDAAKATVWDATWLPWGGAHAITGTATMNARLPGQWFQLEAGLHYNWHRHYDPTIGRYTQPDPLGFVDGPGVYGYVKGVPHQLVDKDGRQAVALPGPPQIAVPMAIIGVCIAAVEAARRWLTKPAAPPEDPCSTSQRSTEELKRDWKESTRTGLSVTAPQEFRRQKEIINLRINEHNLRCPRHRVDNIA